MVTCKERKCLKRSNLDMNGYCPSHARNDAEEPEVAVKCGTCELDVPEDADTKALCCDSDDCKVWYHLNCTNISESLYELMNENSNEDNGLRWLCHKCRNNDPVIKLTDANPVNIPEKPTCNKLRHGTCPHGVIGKRLFKGEI